MQHLILPPANSAQPLYRQVYLALAEEIRAGKLTCGEKLPSKRQLAQDLNLSINTVETAYEMLAAEGYLDAKQRSGFYVGSLVPVPQKAPALPASQPLPAPKYQFNFETASIDTTLFPYKAWQRLSREVLSSQNAVLNHGHRQGDENLRQEIAAYLHGYRGAQCTAEQIIVGAGIEYLLALLAQMFCGACFAVENPGYARAHCVLTNSGAQTAYVPVDEFGMSAEALAQSGASLAYVTPSHQFPTGAAMPMARRTALLAWAAGGERYLIEDDYDAEFRFDTRPLPCLQGLDENGRVIYISTFSKSVAPAIRIGYLVLPQALLPMYREKFGTYSSTVSRFEQQALAQFMHTGQFGRHLNRLRTAYRARRDTLVNELYAAFGTQQITIRGSHTGLHLLLTVHGIPEETLVARAHAHGIHVSGLSAYYMANKQSCPASCVVLGYAGIPQEQLAHAVAALKEAWAAL